MANYKDNDPIGWCGDASRGAALGRRTIQGSIEDNEILTIIHKPWVDGDYDENGTYFGGGNGDNLYWVSSEDGGVDYIIRARDFDDARKQVIKEYPNSRTKIGGDKYCVSLDEQTLQQLLDEQREFIEKEYPNLLESIELNDEIRNAAKAFEEAVLAALEIWVGDNLALLVTEDFGPDNLVHSIVGVMSSLRGGAGYLYYMEHEGAGVGTWDGDWDYLVKDRVNRARSVLKDLSKFVKKATHDEWVGLRNALMNRSFEGVVEEEEDEECDEEDDLCLSQ